MNNNIKAYLSGLARKAFNHYIAAKTLYKLEFFAEAFILNEYSLEQYLKVIWAEKQAFNTKEELIKTLKKRFGHDLGKIYNQLESTDRNYLSKEAKKTIYIAHNALRYADEPWGFSSGDFPNQVKFIRKCHELLKVKPVLTSIETEDLEKFLANPSPKGLKLQRDKILREIWTYQRIDTRYKKAKLRTLFSPK